MVLVPVGEVVAHVGEVGPDDAEPVLDEFLQPLGGVRIRGLAEVGIERGSRGENSPRAMSTPSWEAVSSVSTSETSSLVVASRICSAR